MDDRDIQIGQRIRKYRKEKGMNQSELAEKIGKSLRTVQKYEKGEIEVAISVISDIAEMLGVSSSDILGYKSGIEHIGSLSDIMSFLFMLENVQDVDFKINVQKPSQGGKWECSISFDGQQNENITLICACFWRGGQRNRITSALISRPLKTILVGKRKLLHTIQVHR